MNEVRRCKSTWMYCDGDCQNCGSSVTTTAINTTTTAINTAIPTYTVHQVELTRASLEEIAEEVVRKLEENGYGRPYQQTGGD